MYKKGCILLVAILILAGWMSLTYKSAIAQKALHDNNTEINEKLNSGCRVD
jgi:hypothetical protein